MGVSVVRVSQAEGIGKHNNSVEDMYTELCLFLPFKLSRHYNSVLSVPAVLAGIDELALGVVVWSSCFSVKKHPTP